MVRPSRRAFLIGSAASTTTLTGALVPRSADDRPDLRNEHDLDEDLAQLLESVPAPDAVDATYRHIVLTQVDADTERDLPHEARTAVDGLDVDPADVSTAAMVYPNDHAFRLGAAVGNFDRVETGDEVSTVDDWHVGDDGQVATASDEGRGVAVHGEDDERPPVAVAAAEAAVGETDDLLAGVDAAPVVFDQFADAHTVLFVPDAESGILGTPGLDDVEAFAGGFGAHPNELDEETEHEYLLFVDGEGPSDEEIERLVDSIDPGIPVEVEADRSADPVHVTALVEPRPTRDRDASPDARFDSTFDAAAGELRIEHTDGESVPAADLELYVDGELADEQPEDRLDTFDSGDEIVVETGPLATVGLRWFDADEHAHFSYVNETVDPDAFAFDYDIDAETVTVTYRGDRPADPEPLRLHHRGESGERVPSETFTDEYDELTDGDAVVIEDVTMGDTLMLELDVPRVPGLSTGTLDHFSVRPPRFFVHDHQEEIVARYGDDQPRDADAFRVFVDGEAADVQIADETAELTEGDEIPLGEHDLGSEITIEWTEPDDPTEVATHVVTPRTHAMLEYDPAAGEIEVAHRDGQTLSAADLELRIDGELAATQPADELTEFGEGDVFVVDAPAFAQVELVWTDGDAESPLGRVTTARDAIAATYDVDAESMRLEYVAETPADPEPLRVDVGGGYSSNDNAPFADEYDELTDGDAIAVEDVTLEDRVVVALEHESDGTRSVRSVGHFSAEPRRAFRFTEEDDGTATALYADQVRRPADEFRLLVDGERAETQPADEFDVLESTDEVSLGEVPAGTELTVEWTAPDETRTVGDHVVSPSVSFDVTYDADADEFEIVHDGGDTVDAGDLQYVVIPSTPSPVDLDATGVIEEGDSLTVEVDGGEEPERFIVVFDEREVLTEKRFDE